MEHSIAPFGVDTPRRSQPERGEHFVMVQSGSAATGSERQLNVVLDWFEELERLAPRR